MLILFPGTIGKQALHTKSQMFPPIEVVIVRQVFLGIVVLLFAFHVESSFVQVPACKTICSGTFPSAIGIWIAAVSSSLG